MALGSDYERQEKEEKRALGSDYEPEKAQGPDYEWKKTKYEALGSDYEWKNEI